MVRSVIFLLISVPCWLLFLSGCSEDGFPMETYYGCGGTYCEGYYGLENRDLQVNNGCGWNSRLYGRNDLVRFAADSIFVYELDESLNSGTKYSGLSRRSYSTNLLHVELVGNWLFIDSLETVGYDTTKVPFVLERYVDIANGNSIDVGFEHHFVVPRVLYLMREKGLALNAAENVALYEFRRFWGGKSEILFALEEKMNPDSMLTFLAREQDDFRKDGKFGDSLRLAYFVDEISKKNVDKGLLSGMMREAYFLPECNETHVEQNHNVYSTNPYLVCRLDSTGVPYTYYWFLPRRDEAWFGKCDSENFGEIKLDSFTRSFYVCQSIWRMNRGDEIFMKANCPQIGSGLYKTAAGVFYCGEEGNVLPFVDLDYLHGICVGEVPWKHAHQDSAWVYGHEYYACRDSGWTRISYRVAREAYGVSLDTSLIFYEENKDSLQKILGECSWNILNTPVKKYENMNFICGSLKKNDKAPSWMPTALEDSIYGRFIDVSLPKDNIMDVVCFKDSIMVSKQE